jgi:hypothetical protein
MRRVLVFLERLLTGIAIVAVVGLSALEVFERSGLATEVARGLLSRALPEGRWDLSDCRVDLGGPTLGLVGVSWSRGGVELARVERLDLTLAPFLLGRPRVESVRVAGARVRLGTPLVEGLSGRLGDAEGGGARPEALARRARLDLVDLVLLDASGERTLGRVDARLDLTDRSELALSATLHDGESRRGEVTGRGRLYDDGEVVIDVSTSALPLAPLGALLAERGIDVRGSARLAARARGRSDRLESIVAEVALERVGTSGAGPSLTVEDLSLDGRVEWRAGGSPIGTLGGRVLGRGTWASGPIVCGWRGGEGPFGDVFVHAPDRLIDSAVQDVVKLAVPGEEVIVDNTFRALGVRGRAPVWFGARVVPADPAPRGVEGYTSDLALVGRAGGAIDARVDGWPSDDGELQGFPLPVSGVTGTTVYGHRGDAAMRDRMATLPTIGSVGTGTFRVEGWLASPLPPYARATRATDSRARLRFRVRAENVPIDEQLVHAIERTGAGVDIEELLAPRQGRVHGEIELEQSPLLEGFVIAADTRLEGVSGRWADPPFAFQDAQGTFELRMSARTGDLGADDGERRRALGFRVVARGAPQGEPAARVGVAGTSRTADPLASAADEAGQLFQWSVDVDNLRSDSAVLAPFTAGDGDARALIERYGLRGLVSASYDTSAALFGREAHDRLRIGASDLSADLEGLEFRSGLARVHIERRRAIDDDEGPARTAWAGGFEASALDGAGASWALSAELDGGATESVRVMVAGLEPDRPAYAPLLGDAVPLRGAVDGSAELHLDDLARSAESGAAGPPMPRSARLHLRSAGSALGGLSVTELAGALTLEHGRITAPMVRGLLAGSRFTLRDVTYVLEASGRGAPTTLLLPAGADGRGIPARLVARVFAENVPLEPREFAQSAPGLARWALDHRWRGRVDLEGVDVAVGFDGDTPVVRARGPLVPHDVFAYFSFPVRLNSATIALEDLLVDERGVSASAVVTDAYGAVAGQKLARTACVLELQPGALVVRDLSAQLNGGSVTGFGPEDDARAAALVELTGTPTFRLGLRFQRVAVGDVLADLFGSAVQSRGELSGRLELRGTAEDLLTYRGRGNARVDGARLWSLPVVRDLFAELGLDATATFDWLSTDFELAAGRLLVTNTVAHSPILKLIGGGHLDVDGTLRQRFDLHYSLVDRVPLVSKIFYWFQSRLVRVEVSGTLERPSVRLANLVRDLFADDDEAALLLPLPPTTPLAPRF